MLHPFFVQILHAALHYNLPSPSQESLFDFPACEVLFDFPACEVCIDFNIVIVKAKTLLAICGIWYTDMDTDT